MRYHQLVLFNGAPERVASCSTPSEAGAGRCTRVETGEVGLRIHFDKTVDACELLPGSFNQTLVGSVLTFKVQDVAVPVDNLMPLADRLSVSQVQVRAIVPADVIVQSANELVWAQSELKTKEVEVQTAKKEAERIAALNANAGAIGYMNAMANLKIAEGVASGKVHTIVVPYDFKGIVNAK